MSLTEAFRNQAQSCARLDSPFMQRLLTILAVECLNDGALWRKLAGFTGDIGPSGHSLPLRVCGGLHALVLSGRSPQLAASYPPNTTDDTTLRDAVRAALTQKAKKNQKKKKKKKKKHPLLSPPFFQ